MFAVHRTYHAIYFYAVKLKFFSTPIKMHVFLFFDANLQNLLFLNDDAKRSHLHVVFLPSDMHLMPSLQTLNFEEKEDKKHPKKVYSIVIERAINRHADMMHTHHFNQFVWQATNRPCFLAFWIIPWLCLCFFRPIFRNFRLKSVQHEHFTMQMRHFCGFFKWLSAIFQ